VLFWFVRCVVACFFRAGSSERWQKILASKEASNSNDVTRFEVVIARDTLQINIRLVDVAGFLLHVIHEQVLAQGVRRCEVRFAAAKFRHFLYKVNQAVVAG